MNKNMLTKLSLINLLILLLLVTGCNKVEEEIVVEKEPEIKVEEETPKDPDEIMKEFYMMINGDERPSNVALYVENTIENLDKSQADTMILDYESYLVQDLNLLLKEYEAANSNPELFKTFELGIKDNISSVSDEGLKELLNKTMHDGYLILKGGGYIYPEIDYSEILKQKNNITSEVIHYLELMENEKLDRFTFGEEIEISLEELLKRIKNAENYLVSYPSSRSSKKVYELYNEYMYGAILGTGNPYVLANEGTSILKDEILNQYKTFVANNKESRTAEILQEYINILEKNENNMDVDEVIDFYDNRDEIIEDMFRDLIV